MVFTAEIVHQLHRGVSGYSATVQVTITNKNLQPHLVFDQNGVTAFTDQSKGQMRCYPKANKWRFCTNYGNTTRAGINPGFFCLLSCNVTSCVMSSESPVCYMKVVNQLFCICTSTWIFCSFQASAQRWR